MAKRSVDTRSRHAVLEDVARAAGVNPSTVSRVLNGTARISEATRERVEAAARRLNYRPNRSARFLATRRTMTLGVLLPEMSNLMHIRFLRGAQEVAQAAGYSLMICDGQLDPSVQARELERFMGLRVDGLILTRSFTMTDLLAPFSDAGIPVEPVELVEPQRPSLWRTRRAGSLEAFDDLLARGHRSLAMFVRDRNDAPRRSAEQRSRVWSAREAVRRRGLPPDTLRVVPMATPDGHAATLHDVWSTGLRPTAFIAGNDSMAAPLLAAMSAADIRIPDEASFISYGDSIWAEAYRPALSVIRYDYEAEGRAMTRRVLRRLGALAVDESDAAESLAPDVYIRRRSVAAPRDPR